MAVPRPNDVSQFVSMYAPCASAADALTSDPSVDGKPRVQSMAEAWERAPVGAWVEFIVRLFRSADPAALARLDAIKHKCFAPMLQATLECNALVAKKASSSDIATAEQRRDALRASVSRKYADAIRAEFANPFTEPG